MPEPFLFKSYTFEPMAHEHAPDGSTFVELHMTHEPTGRRVITELMREPNAPEGQWTLSTIRRPKDQRPGLTWESHANAGSIGVAGIRALSRHLKDHYGVRTIDGLRITGTRRNADPAKKFVTVPLGKGLGDLHEATLGQHTFFSQESGPHGRQGVHRITGDLHGPNGTGLRLTLEQDRPDGQPHGHWTVEDIRPRNATTTNARGVPVATVGPALMRQIVRHLQTTHGVTHLEGMRMGGAKAGKPGREFATRALTKAEVAAVFARKGRGDALQPWRIRRKTGPLKFNEDPIEIVRAEPSPMRDRFNAPMTKSWVDAGDNKPTSQWTVKPFRTMRPERGIEHAHISAPGNRGAVMSYKHNPRTGHTEILNFRAYTYHNDAFKAGQEAMHQGTPMADVDNIIEFHRSNVGVIGPAGVRAAARYLKEKVGSKTVGGLRVSGSRMNNENDLPKQAPQARGNLETLPGVKVKRPLGKSLSPDDAPMATVKGLPPVPGTAPIPEGHVRLYHQTSPAHVESIRKNGILLSHARGIEGPKAIYADEHGFYGNPAEHTTVEFHLPKEQFRRPFVQAEAVKPESIVGIHEPWHALTRYLHQEGLHETLRGDYDDMLHDPTHHKAITHLKQHYGDQPLKSLREHLEKARPKAPRLLDPKSAIAVRHVAPGFEDHAWKKLGGLIGGHDHWASSAEESPTHLGSLQVSDLADGFEGQIAPEHRHKNVFFEHDDSGYHAFLDPHEAREVHASMLRTNALNKAWAEGDADAWKRTPSRISLAEDAASHHESKGYDGSRSQHFMFDIHDTTMDKPAGRLMVSREDLGGTPVYRIGTLLHGSERAKQAHREAHGPVSPKDLLGVVRTLRQRFPDMAHLDMSHDRRLKAGPRKEALSMESVHRMMSEGASYREQQRLGREVEQETAALRMKPGNMTPVLRTLPDTRKSIDYDALDEAYEPRPTKGGGKGKPVGSRADQARHQTPAFNATRKRLEQLKPAGVSTEEFLRGAKHEAEHRDVAPSPVTQAKIAAAHLKDDPHYYTKLDRAGIK